MKKNKDGTTPFIALVGQYEGGDLFFDCTKKSTPQTVFNYIMNNVDKDEKIEIYITDLTDEQIADLCVEFLK
jgi:hypothetical protein